MTELPGELAAVEQLLAESDALRAWLTRLDQASPTASGAVRDRVRRDYQQRLDQLTAGLSAHADVVNSKLAVDRHEHADLSARAAEARDGLAEAELRHVVGEYDDQKFAGERSRFASDLETFDVALKAVTERIARLEAVQAVVQRAPRPVELALDAVTDASIDAVPEIGIAELAPTADDGLAVFAEPAVGGPVEPASPENGPLSFRPSGVSGEWPRPTAPAPASVPHARPFDTAPPLGIPAADVPPRFIRPGDRLPSPPAPPANVPPVAEVASAAAPARPADEPVQPATPAESTNPQSGRTLRCGECGAMNRPLEWYCEKCGAELTAV